MEPWFTVAKHTKSRGSSRLQWYPCDQTIAPGTLADGAVLTEGLTGGTYTSDFYCHAVKVTYSLRDLTAGEGTLRCGVAHSDYTAAEVKENLDVDVLGKNIDMISQEQQRRIVRDVGEFTGLSADEVLNDGKPIYTLIKRRIGEGAALNHWIQNKSGAALTTGSTARCSGYIIGKFL